MKLASVCPKAVGKSGSKAISFAYHSALFAAIEMYRGNPAEVNEEVKNSPSLNPLYHYK